MIASRPRTLIAVAVLVGLAGVAEADSFAGVAANEKSYLVGVARICAPLAVTDGAATGMPSCRAGAADDVAGLSTRTPSPERGPKAQLVATAKGRVITVADAAGAPVVTWSSPDAVTSIVDVWRSSTERIVIVEYVVRRGGRELHDVVGFDRGYRRTPPPDGGAITPPVVDDPPVAEVDPAITRAVAAARKAKGKAAIKAWTAVLTLDARHAEALYRMAAIDAAAKRIDAALARLAALAAPGRADAVEWLVEARFDKAFAKLVGEPRFRAAVGLDREPTTSYERLMGLGGQWEQALVTCDRPEIKLALRRDRTLALTVRTVCQGMRDRLSLKGTWAPTDAGLELRLPALDGGHDAAPCRLGRDRDEDVLTCAVDADLTFEARPSRR